MNILIIATRIPYPLTDGGKVCLFNTIKYLALRGHHITLLIYANELPNDLKSLLDVCNVRIVNKSTKDSLIGIIFNLFSAIPYKVSKYISKELREKLIQILQWEKYDVVHVEQLHVAEYGLLCKQLANLPIVLREENVESTIVERFVKKYNIPIIRNYLQNQLDRMRQYEAKIAELFDICCMITDEDQKNLLLLNKLAQTCVITAGVDASYFLDEPSPRKIPHSVCFFGSFAWIPNQDGVLWFLKDIFPKILQQYPDVIFYIIGKDIPSNIRRYQNKNVVIRGFVQDLKRELSQYELTIAPHRIGGGIRIKIIESFAMKVPVVTTSIGCEGIEAKDSEHLLIGDTPEDFANQVLKLLKNEKLRMEITRNAYALADKKYRWEQIAEQFEKMYKEMILKTKHSMKSQQYVNTER